MNRRTRALIWSISAFIAALIPAAAFASPFGQGVFGADVPFGSATSIAIALGGDVSLPLSWDGLNFTGNGSNTVTVTSTDVVGYMLYAHATTTTDMAAPGGATIPASGNSSAAALSAGTWG